MAESKNLQALVNIQGEQIKTYEKLVKLQDERINELRDLASSWKDKFLNAQWIAIFEFWALFTESKGEIVNSRYVQTAFENIGITLDEDTLIKMGNYALEHFKRDEEYTKQMQQDKTTPQNPN